MNFICNFIFGFFAAIAIVFGIISIIFTIALVINLLYGNVIPIWMAVSPGVACICGGLWSVVCDILYR